MGDLEKVQKRHADIDQDALPGLDDVDPGRAPGGDVKRRSPKSVAFAVCPHHLLDRAARNDGKTGLVRDADGELVFREHTKRIGAGTITCPGSGVSA